MNSKTIHLALYDGWADWEAGYAIAHLGSGEWKAEGERYNIVTVGETTNPIKTKGGLTMQPAITVDELALDTSAMLILPGADSWMTGANTIFVSEASRFLESRVPVAAICGATVGLAAAGLLNDRDHTSNAPELLDVGAYSGHARYRQELAVADQNLVTASGVAPVEFAKAIFDQLAFYSRSVADHWYTLYGDQDPSGFFGLLEASSHVR